MPFHVCWWLWPSCWLNSLRN